MCNVTSSGESMSKVFLMQACGRCKYETRYTRSMVGTQGVCPKCKNAITFGMSAPPPLPSSAGTSLVDVGKSVPVPAWAKNAKELANTLAPLSSAEARFSNSGGSGGSADPWAVDADSPVKPGRFESAPQNSPWVKRSAIAAAILAVVGVLGVSSYVLINKDELFSPNKTVVVKDTNPDPTKGTSTNPPPDATKPPEDKKPDGGPSNPTSANDVKIAEILDHEKEIFALEEYVVASRIKKDSQRNPHILVKINDLKLDDKVRFDLQCKKYPNLLNSKKRSSTPEQEKDGKIQTDFLIYIDWNNTELCSLLNRDPQLEIQVECFVNEKICLEETVRFNFAEINILPLDNKTYVAAYVQKDHPEIAKLREKWSKLEHDFDFLELKKNAESILAKELNEELKADLEFNKLDKDNKKTKLIELLEAKLEQEESSYKSILKTYFAWKLIDSLKISYQNLTETDVAGFRHTQRMRTISEVLQSKMGNCIEESILIASIIQQDVSLIFPPRHCMAMVGQAYAFSEAIPLECTILGRVIDIKDYQEVLEYAKNSQQDSSLYRLYRTVELMPEQMKVQLQSDHSWRNYTLAIYSGSNQLIDVFDWAVVISAWTQANKVNPPFPSALAMRSTTAQKEELITNWKAYETEMFNWFEKRDSRICKLLHETRDSDLLTQSGDHAKERKIINIGIGYWYAVSEIAQRSPVDIDIMTYIPIAQMRKVGIVAIPNETVSNPPNQ